MSSEMRAASRWAAYATVLAPPHEPARPSWICLRDGWPWPCEVARAQLATLLKELLVREQRAWLLLAACDMPDADTTELRERFMAWR